MKNNLQVSKKEHSENEYWTYRNCNSRGNATPVYSIDGEIRGSEHGSAQYLIDTYDMNILDAYNYVREISTHGNY